MGHWCAWLFYNKTIFCKTQAPVDIRSTGVGIKCLYCTYCGGAEAEAYICFEMIHGIWLEM